MKTYPFIVINKNNMKELHHFSKASSVAGHLLGRRIFDILIVINEVKVVNVAADLGTPDVHLIERMLNEMLTA